MSNGNDVYNLADGWLELDSDPGLFTLLLQDFGVQGVQVTCTSKSTVQYILTLGLGVLSLSTKNAGCGKITRQK